MRKFLTVLLFLSLFISPALADGDEIIVAGEHYCSYLDDAGNLWVYATAVIENWAEVPQSPVHTGFLVLAKDGSVMIETPPTLYPPVIDSMGRAYVASVFCLDAAQQAQFDCVQLSFFPGSGMAGTSAQYLQADPATGLIKNDTAAAMENVTVLQIYYDEAGAIVGTQLDTLAIGAEERKTAERTFHFAPYASVETIAYQTTP